MALTRVRSFRQWDLWPRLALGVTVGFLLLFGVFSLLSLRAIEDSTNRILEERLIIAKMAATQIDAIFRRAFFELEKATEFADFDPADPNLADEVHMLAHAYGRLGLLSLGVLFLDKTGHPILTQPSDLAARTDDWANQPYIQRTLATGEKQISEPFREEGSGRPTVALVLPLHDKTGGMRALLVGLVDLADADFQEPIANAQDLGKTGHAYIVDASGRIVVSAQPDAFLTPGEHKVYYQRMLATKTTGVESTVTDQTSLQHLMAFVPLQNAPWGVTVGGASAEILAPISQLRNGILLLGLLSLTVVLGATLLGAGLLVQPVKQLIRATQRIAAGDLAQPVRIEQGGEIGLLGQNLESMRTRLAASFQEWNNALEQRVQERTRELEILNTTLRAEEANRRQLLARMITVQEEERKRIAQELHDGTGQVLAATVIGLEATERALPVKSDLRLRVVRSRELIQQVISDIHGFIADLRPGVLDELGLPSAIRWAAQNHLEPLNIDYVVRSDLPNDRPLSSVLETVLFRIAQESISNIARHARANQVDVALRFCHDQVRLTISDNGVGFDPAAVQTTFDDRHGLGLAGMWERAALIGGRLTIASHSGQGTTIDVLAPLQEEER
jgi:signal transduction histidine kinase